ncbi:Chromosome partition protein Smc [bacterium HR28]|uniref:DNA recombination protein RmuC n=1 Tax=Thermomicrobium roseum TaxID=500 RepID=A0A7C1JUW3_THERO|nr:Chromosome partition protein Smc [bacterium HR28]
MGDGGTLLVAGVVGFVGFALLVFGIVLGTVLSRRPTTSSPDLGAMQASLASLQEAARAQGQQVSDLLRSLQELAALTTQLQARAQANEQHQLQLQHSFQLMSQGLGELRATFAALPALQEATHIQAQRLDELTRTLETLKTLTAQLQARADASEQRQSQLHAGLQRTSELLGELRTSLTSMLQQQGATVNRIDQLQQALAAAHQALNELRRNDEEARRQQEELARFVTRLDTILTGSASRGAAGEHVLEAILEHLPPEFKAFNLTIRNRTVEFAFRLPNGKHVPIDSKWVGIRQLEQLDEASSEQTRKELEQLLARRIEEVTAYLDLDLTLGLAIVAVPDAVYRWTQRLHARALEKGVIVIAYSMAIPYFLTLLHFAIRFLRDEETAQLSAITHQLEHALREIQSELNGRYARALTMLQNSRDALAQQAAGALGTLRQLQALSGASGTLALAEALEGEQRVDE